RDDAHARGGTAARREGRGGGGAMTESVPVSFGLAFLAGLVSFLSPCVLPIVPSYVSFVTGLTLDDLREHGDAAARRHAALHAGLFILRFSALFIALGASASTRG